MCRKYLPLQGTLIKEKALHQQVDRHVLKQNRLNRILNEYAPANIFNTENFINVAQLNFINVDDHTAVSGFLDDDNILQSVYGTVWYV